MAAGSLEFPLELIVLGLGAWLYARMTTFASAKGRYMFWGFVILLAALQIYANFGPPPIRRSDGGHRAIFYLVWPYWPYGSSGSQPSRPSEIKALESTAPWHKVRSCGSTKPSR